MVFYFYFLENTSHIKLAISTISQCGVQRHPFASAGSRPPSPGADTVPVAAPAPRSSSATPPAWGRARQRSHTPRVLPCLAGHSASRFPASSAPPSSFGPAGFHRAHTSHSVYRSPVMDRWLRPPFGCRGRRCSERVRTRVRLSPGLRLFGGHTHVRADLLLRVAPLHLPFRGPADRSPPPPAGVCAPGRPGSASFRSVALRWVSGGVSLGFTLRFPDD